MTLALQRTNWRARAGNSCLPLLFWSILLVCSGLVLSGCALTASAPPEKVGLRPAPSRTPTYTVSGRSIIATPGPLNVTVRPLAPEDVLAYFQKHRKKNPFGRMRDDITPFYLRIENRSRDQLTLDSGLTILKDQENRGVAAFDAAELFQTFAENPTLLQAAQKEVITGYLVIAPDRSREGLLVFPAIPKDAKAVFLQITSLYVGPTAFPLIFEFEVVPKE